MNVVHAKYGNDQCTSGIRQTRNIDLVLTGFLKMAVRKPRTPLIWIHDAKGKLSVSAAPILKMFISVTKYDHILRKWN